MRRSRCDELRRTRACARRRNRADARLALAGRRLSCDGRRLRQAAERPAIGRAGRKFAAWRLRVAGRRPSRTTGRSSSTDGGLANVSKRLPPGSRRQAWCVGRLAWTVRRPSVVPRRRSTIARARSFIHWALDSVKEAPPWRGLAPRSRSNAAACEEKASFSFTKAPCMAIRSSHAGWTLKGSGRRAGRKPSATNNVAVLHSRTPFPFQSPMTGRPSACAAAPRSPS